MTAQLNSEVGRGGFMTVDLEGSAVAAECWGSIANPEAQTIMVLRAYLLVTTPAVAAATLNVGIAAAEGADANDIISAFDLSVPGANTVWNGVDLDIASEAAMTTPALWESSKYLTFTNAANASTGFTGKLFLEYLRL